MLYMLFFRALYMGISTRNPKEPHYEGITCPQYSLMTFSSREAKRINSRLPWTMARVRGRIVIVYPLG
jgi:hypothetical protein